MTTKRYLTLYLAAFLPLAGFATVINRTEARSLAADFFEKSGISASLSEPTRQTLGSNSQTLPYYVFNADNNNGFVIIAGDNRLGSVLGYSDSGSFSLDDAPDGLVALMKLYEQYMAKSTESENVVSVTAAGTPAMQPLLGNIEWGQDTPFNSLCPTYTESGKTTNYYTGCVVTAATQIMKYYDYPAQGTGSKSYTFNGATLSADFGNTTYNWSNMPGAVPESPNPIQENAYSTLAYHFGIAVEMQYAKDGSGAYTMMVPTALKDYFGYDKALRLHTREYYTSKEWLDMIKAELDAKRPVYYGASSDVGNGGHAFVCDGYDSNDYVHINWGWYGRSNGYFLINHLNPSSLGEGGGTGGYNRSQEIITGIMPAAENSPKACTIYGATRLSCSGYGNQITMMSFVENLDTEAFEGLIGGLLLKDGKIVKVLGTEPLTIGGFKNGHSGTAQIYMRDISTDASGVNDGDGYILKLGVQPAGSDEWIVLRHPIGLPAYVNASVINGLVVVGDQHQPSPDVVLIDPLLTDGQMFANCHALVHFNMENRSADCRLKNITVRFTSVEDASATYDMNADVNIYDLSTEEFDLLMQLPEEIPAGNYYLTAFETSYPSAVFDDSEAGRTKVTVEAEATEPKLRLTSTPMWADRNGNSDICHAVLMNIAVAARNYGGSGTAAVLCRLTDVNNPEHSYIFIQQDIATNKGQAHNLAFSRKMIADPGTYSVEFSSIDADGNETPVSDFTEPALLTVNESEEADIEVLELDMPSELVKGVSATYNMTVKAVKDFSGTVFMRIRRFTNTKGEIVLMKSGVRLTAGQQSDISFRYKPAVEAGRYMTMVETRPAGVASGSEIPALGLANSYREILVTDPSAAIGGVTGDKTTDWAVAINGNSIEVLGNTPVKSLCIYNVAGQLLNRTTATNVIGTDRLQHGTYILKIETEKASTALKFKK